MLLADIAVLLIPLWILLGLVVLLGILALLARIQNGRYLRPLVNVLAKVPLFRKGMQKASNAALEKSNPELASAMKKMQRHGTKLNDPQQAQRAMSQLTRDERRALLDLQQQQQDQGVGPAPEAMNRQMRRRMEKAQKNAKRR